MGLQQTITMSFLLVGHTKFAPDWCFGLLMQRYRLTFVSSLQDIVDVIEASSHVNTAQLVGTENGTVIVPTYNWVKFLCTHFKRIPHLKSYHHFSFSASHPGLVSMKKFSDSEGSPFQMLHDREWEPQAHFLPPYRIPPELSNSRKLYLYQQIRSQFLPPGH